MSCALLAASGFAALARGYNQPSRFGWTPYIDGAALDGTEAALSGLKQTRRVIFAPLRHG